MTPCLAHHHDQPVPLVPLHLQPPARGGLNSPSIMVCANTERAVYDLLERIEHHALISHLQTPGGVISTLPSIVWRQYGGIERTLAYRSWFRYGTEFLAGDHAEAHAAWYPDGRPKRARGLCGVGRRWQATLRPGRGRQPGCHGYRAPGGEHDGTRPDA